MREDRIWLSLGWRGLGLFVLLQGVGSGLLMALVTWVFGWADGLEASLKQGAWFGALMTVWWVGVVVVTRYRARHDRGND